MAKILLICCLFFLSHIITADAQATLIQSACGIPVNVTDTSSENRYSNMPKFLENLGLQAEVVWFYNVTERDTPDKPYGFFQCRYDLNLQNCSDCVMEAVNHLLEECIEYEYGVVHYEECMLIFSYENKNIFSFNKSSVSADAATSQSYEISRVADFNKVLAKGLQEVIKMAAKGNNGIYFSASETKMTSSETLYCFAQCIPIINGSDCQVCLQNAFSELNDFATTNTRAMFRDRFCQLTYDNKTSFSFKDDLVAPSPSMISLADQVQQPSTLPSSNKEPSIKPAVIIAITSAASFGFVLLIAGLWLVLRKRPQESFQMPGAIDELRNEGALEDIGSLESLQFDFKGVQAATCNFSVENKLGQGGFGEVYKGNFSNGEEVAVKRLSTNSQQGGSEFKNEVVLLAKLQHKNLVKLLGFCISREEKILIYEFLSNSSLDRFLNDPVMRTSLEWELRFRIITGISRGLLYLHEDSRLKIIHRDLKTSNILLDEEMNAKIADFGIAKLFDSDQTQGSTMRIAGTYGYMAPEYALAGHFSVKSDVYSFGVIVLEIVSGQRNEFFRQEQNEGLLHRAWRLWNEDATLQLVDPLLGNKFYEQEAMLCIQIGLLCVQEDASHRPRMTSVVHALNGESINLPSPNAPHIFTISSDTDETPSNYDSVPEDEVRLRTADESDGVYTGTMTATDLYPR